MKITNFKEDIYEKVISSFSRSQFSFTHPGFRLRSPSSSKDIYATTDTWFTIEPDRPHLEVHYRTNSTTPENQELGYESYRNEQSFFAFNFDLKGQAGAEKDSYYYSFLTGFGLFAGIYLESNSFMNGGDYSTKVMYSPGFRIPLDDLSYIAVSVDYITINNPPYEVMVGELADYEINMKYYTDNMKIFGNFLSYTDPVFGQSYFNLGANYQVSEPLVVGASLLSQKTWNKLLVGSTYKTDLLIADGELIINSYSSGSGSNQIRMSGMFLLGDYIKAGAEYYKSSSASNGYLTLKAAAGGQNTKFIFKYRPKNESYTSQMSLSFEHKR